MVVVEAVAAEAAKVVTGFVLSGMVKGGRLLRDRLQQKMGEIPEDPGRARDSITAWSQHDPDSFRQLARELSLTGDCPGVPWSPIAPEPFWDREEYLRRIPEDGVYLAVGSRGTGRASLVRRIAELRAEKFPHGCVDVDLDDHRSGDLGLVDSVRREVLRRLGVSAADVTEATDELRQQYLSITVRHSFVLILRNALGHAEIAPFENSPVNLVLVTTTELTGDLRAKYGQYELLGGLDPAGAWQLLASRCGGGAGRDGADLLRAEPEATGALLHLCGYVPFVLEVIGGELGRRYGEPEPVHGLFLEYENAGAADGPGVLGEWVRQAWDALDESVAAAACSLAVHPGPDFTPVTADALLGARSRPVLDQLTDRGLLHGDGHGRYRLLEPIRDHAARRGHADETAAAIARLTGFFARHAMLADLQGAPDRLRGYDQPAELNATDWTIPGYRERPRTDWLVAERQTIAALVPQAHRHGLHEQVCQIVGAFEAVLNRVGDRRTYAAMNEYRVRSATEIGQRPDLLARACGMHARLHTQFRYFPAAHQALEAADAALRTVVLSERERTRLESSTLEMWGRYYEEQGDVAALTGNGDPAERYRQAIDRFHRAVGLDQRIADHRACGIHARMLARAYRKVGLPGEALRYLPFAVHEGVDPRNVAAGHLVWAGVLVALGGPHLAEARDRLDHAGRMLREQGVTQYYWEFGETAARLETVAGRRKDAIARWDELVKAAFAVGHPRTDEYLAQRWQLGRP
ncbi:hypothetical protein CFN78_09830 [Amycolatopsis antarctica]|uniref:Uncharacterized protein n=1 Tax=Amycolatopsis antarctica TaxID=1854586 RepID=A0A263D4P8_9PSEU|nr:hypothetical protein [Amycolatopsis antarctica]OZM73169.1 hypothetical protein CFN78_09830 [Amycolatopsis antarctica]